MAGFDARERLIVALDYGDLAPAQALVDRLGCEVLWYKVGLELFTAVGPPAVRALKKAGKRVFLDLKLHDIPNTVARAVASAAALDADLVDLHVSAGPEALRAAVASLQALPKESARPRLLGVTVLTSARTLDGAPLTSERLVQEVVARARAAQEAGLDGVVAPVPAIGAVAAACGRALAVLTPGIRPTGSARGDQTWIATPGGALCAGARWIVVGRPITAAADPAAAAREILTEMRDAAQHPGFDAPGSLR